MDEISADFPFAKRKAKVLGSEMAYVEAGPPAGGGGPTVVFLHGNPTSSYLWRNVIPHVAPIARCVAPDLIGMGDSDKLPAGSEYRFADHARYLGAFLDAVVPDGKVVPVLHDWGSGLGFDWARRHEGRLAGLAFMEFVQPWKTWEAFPDNGRDLFRALRSPAGRKLAVDDNVFVEAVLPGGVVRRLGEAEMARYRAPFLNPADREPLYRFPNDVPIAGEPPDVYAAVQAYHDWLLASDLPKLFFWAHPGLVVSEPVAAWYRQHLRNARSVDVGPGLHYLQEDNPHRIGREIAAWLPGLGVGIS